VLDEPARERSSRAGSLLEPRLVRLDPGPLGQTTLSFAAMLEEFATAAMAVLSSQAR
jgi:hypothetical protein